MKLNTADIFSVRTAYHTVTSASKETIAHVATLVALLGFILVNRIRNYTRIVESDGTITFTSVDGWYHRRATVYTVENYPQTLDFDPYSGFDVGNRVGQFGTLFDQALATVALVAGGGDPSLSTVDFVLAFAPPVLAVGSAVAVYVLGKAVSNRWGGLVAVGVLALTPGLFLSHSVVGSIDHHIAETLLVSTSLCCCVKFASNGEGVTVRGMSGWAAPFDSPLLWGVLAGVVNAVYLLIWPPGLLYIAILSVFLAMTTVAGFLIGEDQTPVALTGGVMMIITGTATLPFVSSSALSVTKLSLIQALLPLVIGVACILLGYTTHRASKASVKNWHYLTCLVTCSAVAISILAVSNPNTIDFFVQNSGRVFWFVDSGGGTEIAEASTLSNPLEFGFMTYGFALIAAALGWLLMVKRLVSDRANVPVRVLLVTFAFVISSATISQPRFDYYLVIAVAVFATYAVYELHGLMWRVLNRRSVNAPKLASNVAATGVAILILTPLALSGAPIIAADSYTAPASHDGWDDSVDWISSETPEFGAYGVESPARVDYTGDFPTTEDYDYKPGQYGILNRWTNGHRLTVEANRAPVANPHQQHTTVTANVLLAPSEDAATAVLDSELDEGSGVRYVVLGRPLGTGTLRSFSSPAASESAYGLERRDLGVVVQGQPDGEFHQVLQTGRSYESLRTRLYQFHGSAAPASKLVIQAEEGELSQKKAVGSSSIDIERYNNAESAAAASEEGPALHGGLYGEPPQQIDALQHFRLVHASESTVRQHSGPIADEYPEVSGTETSAVKTFERVPGAPITGRAPVNATVKARVDLRITTTGRMFTYTQYATANERGEFRLVVPYATTAYEQYRPETGYTNTSVRAAGPYRISTVGENAADSVTVQVPEGAVLGEESLNATVQLNQTGK